MLNVQLLHAVFPRDHFKLVSVECSFVWRSQRDGDVLMFSVLAAAPASLCHSNDADSAVVMTFPHCHANIPRSLWPAVSLSPTIRPSLANKLPACFGPILDAQGRPHRPEVKSYVHGLQIVGWVKQKWSKTKKIPLLLIIFSDLLLCV